MQLRKLFPHTLCPKCNGPITFLDVLGIISPFQSISCTMCGEDIYLKHPWKIFSLYIITIIILGASVLVLAMRGWIDMLWVYVSALAFLVVLEMVVTVYIIRVQAIRVRREGE